MLFSAYTDIAVARCGAARLPGQRGYVCLCSCSGIEAVDGRAARVVEKVGLRARDEMAELIMSARVSLHRAVR